MQKHAEKISNLKNLYAKKYFKKTCKKGGQPFETFIFMFSKNLQKIQKKSQKQ